MKLTKDGAVVVLNDKAHIDAYLSSGWKPVDESAPVKATTSKPTIIKQNNN